MLVALLATVIAGVGGAYAWVQASVPTHKVPSVENLTEQKADARLKPFAFKVHKQRKFVDGTIPGQVTAQDPDTGATRKEGSTITLTVSKGPSPVRVPTLANRDQAAATAALERADLKVGTVTLAPNEDIPPLIVLDWSPKGRTLPKGTAVDLIVSSGPAPRTIDDFAGKTYDEAALVLASVRLTAKPAEDYSDSIATGRVIRTDPPKGTSVPRDAAVTVVVSKGPNLVTVPPLKGLTVDAATAALDRVGLGVSNIFGPPRKRVFDSDPVAGTQSATRKRCEPVHQIVSLAHGST